MDLPDRRGELGRASRAPGAFHRPFSYEEGFHVNDGDSEVIVEPPRTCVVLYHIGIYGILSGIPKDTGLLHLASVFPGLDPS